MGESLADAVVLERSNRTFMELKYLPLGRYLLQDRF